MEIVLVFLLGGLLMFAGPIYYSKWRKRLTKPKIEQIFPSQPLHFTPDEEDRLWNDLVDRYHQDG